MARRPPLPTLTEEDIREQGERATLPPPVPIVELVGKMMDDVDEDWRSAGDGGGLPASHGRRVPPQVSPSAQAELVLDELGAGAEADVLAEIGEVYLACLGSRTHLPFLVAPPEAAIRASLDHWAGFVLSLVDGARSVDDVLAASTLPEVEALRLLSELRDRGLIDVRAAPPRRQVPRPAKRAPRP